MTAQITRLTYSESVGLDEEKVLLLPFKDARQVNETLVLESSSSREVLPVKR